MEMKQFDVLLHDAEVKLKRLKALYEQWFQGIERLEPLVPRKDLDRLFQTLGKNKPRNTAARFKLQQLQARYNVYSSYWQRIARQIEEGTYERDLRRARRRRGGMPASPAEAKTYELDVDVELDDMGDLDDEIANVLSALESPAPSEPAPAPRRALSAFSPFAMGAKKGAAPAPAPDKRANDATSPGAPRASVPEAGRPPGSSSSEKPFTKPPVTATFGKPKSAAEPAAPRPGAAPGAHTPSLPSAGLPSDGARAARPPVPSAAAPGTAARPPAPRPPPARPSAERRPPPPPPGAAARRPGPPPPPPKADEATRQIYAAYVDARRRNNERVDNVPYDKMADSIEKMRSRLEAKHGKKKIDFEVVVQNGRVGLKPKIE